ncbi:hypothetical protein GF343_05000 [Candidatus Woesearchaeota archaeon]|nr:hypothetical protein [Candidatus Woesearchaeota archaeon]
MKRILIVLAVLFLAAACTTMQYENPGQAVYQETPGVQPIVFMSTNACHKMCMQKGYEQGTCKPRDSFAQAEIEIGECVVDYSVTCKNPGDCKCYCWRKPGHSDPRLPY